MKHGIDVSYAQGKVDWTKAKTDFVMIKCNTGINCPDVEVTRNAVGCSHNKIPFGFYHWATLNSLDVVGDAKAEAAEFIHRLKNLPKYSPLLPPALDIEEDNQAKLKLPPEKIELWIMTFYTEMIKAGHQMSLYSYGPWLNLNLPVNHKLGNIPLWLAAYPWDRPDSKYPAIIPKLPTDEKDILKRAPKLPNGWSKIWMWQYTGQGVKDWQKTFLDLNIIL